MSSDSKNVVVALIKNTEGKYLLLRLAHWPATQKFIEKFV